MNATKTPVHVAHDVQGPAGGGPLVLSNSLGTTWGMWDAQAGPLADRFRLVRYDLRGHGRSPVVAGPYDIADLGADLLALLDRLDVARAHLCGVSLGGMVCLWVAAHAPERVDRVVVFCTSANLGPPEAWLERAATVRAHGTAAVADAVVARWFTPDFRRLRPRSVDAMRAMLAATPAEGYAGCCEAIAGMDLRADLPAVRARTLAVAAADDPATPPAHAHAIAGAIPGCRVVVVDRAAHLLNVERPAVATGLVLAHLGA